MASPHPYQIPAIEKAVTSIREYRRHLNMSATGTGKTFMAAFAARELGLRPTVICPKAVIPAWRRALTDCGMEGDVINYDGARLSKHPAGSWKVKNRVFQWQFPKNSMLIFDEVHRCKGPTSQNGKMLIAARNSRTPTMMLSATPFITPLDMKAIGYVLGLFSKPNDWWNWCRGPAACRPGAFGGLEYWGGSKVMGQIRQAIDPLVSQVKISDVPDGYFGENHLQFLRIPVARPKVLNEIYRQLAILLQNASEHLVEILRLRQQVEIMKVEALRPFVDDYVEQGHKLFVPLNFRESVESAAKLYGHECSIILGQQSGEEREAEIARFQDGDSKICLATISSGGLGISLHDTRGDAPRLSLISPTYSAIDFVQALGRIHRAGMKSDAVQKIVIADGTIEEEVEGKLSEKLDNLGAVTDTDFMP